MKSEFEHVEKEHTQIDPRHLMTDMSQSFRGPVGITTKHKQVYQIWLIWRFGFIIFGYDLSSKRNMT